MSAGPTKEQIAESESLRSLIVHSGWQEVYGRGVERMRQAQTVVMAKDTTDQQRAVEAGVWREIKRLIEYPLTQIEYVTHLEERTKKA